ncbi:MAG: 16S rRNA (cytosine(967)-C(5))-methyltransferase RsmB [Nitrospirae bacterium]|nr:16S rRNA (cytosine(967)-C(5))-methyltransferase RsmB [Nitrospirota bacterium]
MKNQKIKRNKNPRLVVVYSLIDVFQKGYKPKECINRYGRYLNKKDRAMFQEILYGVLRNALYLEWILRQYLPKPEKTSKTTLYNLMAGLYQAIYMRVPDWAVVNETVDVEKHSGRKPSLVNGVLRNFLRSGHIPSPEGDFEERLAVLTSHPVWMIKRWSKRFGREETERLVRANNEIPPLVLRVNLLRYSRDYIMKDLLKKGIKAEHTKYSPAGLKILPPYDFRDIEGMIGKVFIQDEAAQLISYLLDVREGMRILDACAAPGGKTTHIAEITEDKATIVAVDLHPDRLKQLKENILKGGYRSIGIVQGDVNSITWQKGFDRILLDSPCSSLGVIRRNPDLKYRYKGPEEIERFKQKQLHLLLNVSNYLREGGILVYSVCSFEPEETKEVVDEFLHKRKDFYIIDRMDKFECFFDKDGYFFTFPHRDNMDGFFAVRLSRR